MPWTHVGLLLAYSVAMSSGQVLFKLAARSLQAPIEPSSLSHLISRFALNPYFVVATLMYFGLSVAWVYILTFIPLSRAYPFVAAAFIITPLLGVLLFYETLEWRFVMGAGLIVSGLILIAKR